MLLCLLITQKLSRKTERMWLVWLSVFRCFLTLTARGVEEPSKSRCLASVFLKVGWDLSFVAEWLCGWNVKQMRASLYSFTDLRSHFKWFRFYRASCKIMFRLLSVLIIYFFCTAVSFFYMYVCNYLSVRYWEVHCFIYWSGWLCVGE